MAAQVVATGTPGVSRLVFPAGTDLLHNRWINFDATTTLGTRAFVLSDVMGAPSSHDIDVEPLPATGTHIDALVSGRIQWHGYSSSSLYLTASGPASVHLQVSLIR